MEIEINCCNNIDKANITLAEKKLNIKFVPEEFSMLINKAILQTSVLK